MNLKQHIEEIRVLIQAGRFTNEASVSQGIVLRILGALGWQTWDTQIVSPEFSVGGRRVDYALCHPTNRPKVFIEVKQIGQSDGAERQLFEYAFHAGIPLAVLTDGRDWNFFHPAGAGDYGERRVYKLDIVERDIDECVKRFERYLDPARVANGTALAAVADDYQNVGRKRLIGAALPKAWFSLIESEDEHMIEVLAQKVEDECGFRPDPDTVAEFLREELNRMAGTHTLPNAAGRSPGRRQPEVIHVPNRVESVAPGTTGFVLKGTATTCRNGREVLVKAIEALAASDSAFLERFASLPKHGRSRRYISRNRQELYPERPDLAEEFSYQLPDGYWLGINVSHKAVERILSMACDVAGLRYGVDLRVNLES